MNGWMTKGLLVLALALGFVLSVATPVRASVPQGGAQAAVVAAAARSDVAESPAARALVARRVYPNRYPYGWCTWWAAHTRLTENLNGLGNAWHWIYGANARHMRTGHTPRVGATVVLQPYIQGAGYLGHVAHVVRIGKNGWFLTSNMAWYAHGGGWGRVSYVWFHTGRGVSFIY